MPIDINMLRADKGGDPDAVRASEIKRTGKADLVDEVIEIDRAWVKLIFKGDELRKVQTQKSTEMGKIMQAKGDATALRAEIMQIKKDLEEVQKQVKETETSLNRKLKMIGNIVHSSVPVSNDENDNKIMRTHGQLIGNPDGKLYHHHELLHMIDGYSSSQGVEVAGHRGYFLKGVGVLLNQALINYGLQFLIKKGYTPLQPPYFMKKEIMAETAQLEEFDEALYHVQGDGEDSSAYLIATSEQPISAYHRKEWLEPETLPKLYAGYSTCFRKEAGSHGRDAWGIFRIHQFEKIEQFVVCAPDESWKAHEEMAAVAEEYLESLGLAYRTVNIVSGELNNAAAKKYDIEAWFPTLEVYRELVSSSNCTDYQSRAMETRFGQKKMGGTKEYVHMLNATLCATERTICCLLENYQCEEGVRVPEVLQPFMGGMKLMPFVQSPPVNVTKLKQEAKAGKKKKEKK